MPAGNDGSVPATLRETQHGWMLGGTVDLTTVPKLVSEVRPILARGAPVTIDLAEVARIDSAGLSLLVEWLRLSAAQGITLTYRNIPRRMLPIVEACGLAPVLPSASFQA